MPKSLAKFPYPNVNSMWMRIIQSILDKCTTNQLQFPVIMRRKALKPILASVFMDGVCRQMWSIKCIEPQSDIFGSDKKCVRTSTANELELDLADGQQCFSERQVIGNVWLFYVDSYIRFLSMPCASRRMDIICAFDAAVQTNFCDLFSSHLFFRIIFADDNVISLFDAHIFAVSRSLCFSPRPEAIHCGTKELIFRPFFSLLICYH